MVKKRKNKQLKILSRKQKKIFVKNRLIILIVLIVVVFVIGYGFGFYKGKGSMNAELQGQILGLQNKLDAANSFFEPTPENITSLSGTVTKISDNIVVFEFPGLFANPLEEFPKIRTAVVDEETTITKRVHKNTEEWDAEFRQYERLSERALITGASEPEPPEQYKDVESFFEEISIGDAIYVDSDENIRDAEEFEVTKIVFETKK